MVSALQYLTMTRLYVTFTIYVVFFCLCMFPYLTHLHAVKRIFKCLWGALDYGLQLRANASLFLIIT